MRSTALQNSKKLTLLERITKFSVHLGARARLTSVRHQSFECAEEGKGSAIDYFEFVREIERSVVHGINIVTAKIHKAELPQARGQNGCEVDQTTIL